METKDMRMVRQDLVTDYMDKAERYARTLCAGMDRLSVATTSDAVSGAYLGLIEAARRFREGIGTDFWHYASCYVKKYVLKEIRELEYSGSDDSCMVRFEDYVDEDGESLLDGVLAATSRAVLAEEELRAWEREEVARRMARLTETERKVIRMLYGFEGRDMTVREVAHECGTEPATVRKMRNVALRKMGN